jgi:hypothetical protein
MKRGRFSEEQIIGILKELSTDNGGKWRFPRGNSLFRHDAARFRPEGRWYGRTGRRHHRNLGNPLQAKVLTASLANDMGCEIKIYQEE